MKVSPADRITDEDVRLRERCPDMRWIITWEDEGTKAAVAWSRAHAAAQRVCRHRFTMWSMHTFIAFRDEEDAELTYLALV